VVWGHIYKALYPGSPPKSSLPLTTTIIMNASETYSDVPRAPMFLPSSPDPSLPPLLTPPPLKHVGSPYARSPLPPVPEDCLASSLSMNRVLRFALKPHISFDLHVHPSTIATLPDHRPLSLYTLSEPATQPPLPLITVVSPHFPWSITVTPPLPNKAKKYITVSDVLVTLHRTLNLSVTPDEHNSIPSGAVSRVNAEYERRLKNITSRREREAERRKGIKRIDFLIGRYRFLGLSKMGKDPEVFVLNVF
jgi:hypothetical protein